MKICNILGARPQFIKYFPISRAIKAHNSKNKDSIVDILVHTGQHYDYKMSSVFFDELGIRKPDYHLGVGSASHGRQTGEILRKTEEVLVKENPDVVMVYGDTNTTLAGALAAAKLQIPVAHVEAGLRSFNQHMPEEINRVATDHISSLLFCPSRTSVEQLKREGFDHVINKGCLCDEDTFQGFGQNKTGLNGSTPLVINSGDVMYDVFLFARDIALSKSGILERLQLTNQDFGLLTMHRAENTDDEEQFLQRVRFVRKSFKGRKIIFPVHPRTRERVQQFRSEFGPDVQMIDPVSYFDLLMLLEACDFVLTDSGGLQKEAYWAKKPCITLRDETEWVETLQHGWNTLYANYKGIPKKQGKHQQIYGNGRAAQIIVQALNTIMKNGILSKCFLNWS